MFHSLPRSENLQQAVDNFQKDDAKTGTEDYVQPHEGFPPEINAIAPVDNLIALILVLVKHCANIITVRLQQFRFVL